MQIALTWNNGLLTGLTRDLQSKTSKLKFNIESLKLGLTHGLTLAEFTTIRNNRVQQKKACKAYTRILGSEKVRLIQKCKCTIGYL